MLTTLSVAARRRVPSSTRLLSVSTPRHTRSDSLAPHPAHTLDSSNTDSMAHELQVEGDKVIERDEKGNIVSEKDYDRVIRGYKAATHNPRVSPEHKKEAAEILHDLEKAHGDTPSAATSSSHKHGEGHKGRAPVEKHVSSSAHAEGGEHHAAAGSSSSAEHEEEVHRHRVIGGLKANLHRDDRSEQTKESIREKLHEMGEDAD